MTNLATGNAKHALAERKDDLYETPPEAVHALLKVEPLPKIIWEPACGPGSIARVLRAAGHDVVATDLVDYGLENSTARRDFLFETSAPDGCECIVTNPPFKNAEEFVVRAIQLVPKVVMLMRLGFIESERRRPILDRGELSKVYVFRNRLPMMHRHGWDGPKGGSAICYAWFVWDRGHIGPTELKRISWEPLQ